MFTQLNLTSDQLLLTIAGVFVMILAMIFVGRILMKRGKEHLTEKYKDKEWNSPLQGRKYPEVDVFGRSSTVFKLGLVLSLALTVGLMNWTTYEDEVVTESYDFAEVVDIEIEPPRTAEPPPPPPPPPPPTILEVPEEFDVEVEDQMEFMDQSIEAESIVDAPPPVPKKVENAAPPPPPPPPPEEDVEEIFKIVEEMPRFPGCEDLAATAMEKKQCADAKLMEFIYANIKYPTLARENQIEGNVVAQFVVNRDGSIESISVPRDIGAGCGNEVVRVLEMMNEQGIHWIPGRQRDKKVRVLFMLPVRFKLLES